MRTKRIQLPPDENGFQPRKGTERALLRYDAAVRLDLKAAYDRVPRDKLMDEIRRRLSFNVASMITHSFQTITFMVIGDENATKGIIWQRVPQGSPVQEESDDHGEEHLRLNIFADDVMVMARKKTDIRNMLNAATQWAGETCMTWSPNKCYVLPPRDINRRKWMLIRNCAISRSNYRKRGNH